MIQSGAGFQHVDRRTGVFLRVVTPVPAVNGAAAAIWGHGNGTNDRTLFRSDLVTGEGVCRVWTSET